MRHIFRMRSRAKICPDARTKNPRATMSYFLEMKTRENIAKRALLLSPRVAVVHELSGVSKNTPWRVTRTTTGVVSGTLYLMLDFMT